MTDRLTNTDVADLKRRRFYGALLCLTASACCLYLSIDLTGHYRWVVRIGYVMIMLFYTYRLIKARPLSIWSRTK